jgi:hypothetical protein
LLPSHDDRRNHAVDGDHSGVGGEAGAPRSPVR